MLYPELLDRLVASQLVPYAAKLAALEAWDDELASAPPADPRKALREQIARAMRRLRGAPSELRPA